MVRESLAEACAARPLVEKWLLAPSFSIGRQWVERVARGGAAVVNVRVHTVLSMAEELARPAMVARGLRRASDAACEVMAAGAWPTVAALRLAGVRGRGARQRKLLAAYEAELDRRELLDAAGVLELGMAGARGLRAVVLAPELGATGLEARLLAAVPTVKLEEAAGTSEVEAFRAVDVASEVRHVLRLIVQRGWALDDVEVLYADGATYASPIYEMCRRYAVAVTFAEGVAATYSRVGASLAQWLRWRAEGYPAGRFARLLRDGLLRGVGRGAAGVFASLGVGLGRGSYEARVAAEVGELEARVAAGEDLRARLATAERLLRVVQDVMTVTAEGDARKVLEGARAYLARVAAGRAGLDEASRDHLGGRIDEVLGVVDDDFPAVEWLEELARGARVARHGPRPGCLHVAPLAAGGHSGRPHTFVLGLADGERPARRGELSSRVLAGLSGTVTSSCSGRDPWGAPVAFVPGDEAQCLDEADWWLLQLSGRPARPGRSVSGRRRRTPPDRLAGVKVLWVPADGSGGPDRVAWEADVVARYLRRAFDARVRLPRTRREARPGDCMLVSWCSGDLAKYAAALARYGLPHRVTGRVALDHVPEVGLLQVAARAVVEPENAVALVAALRSECFGLGDAQLEAFGRAGGAFDWRRGVPSGLEAATTALFDHAFGELRRFGEWFWSLPPVPVLERMAGALGLFERAALGEAGSLAVGSLAATFELLRGRQEGGCSAAELVGCLGELAEVAAVSALPEDPDGDAVRVMDLHQPKGLEAPVVFLVGPGGGRRFAAGARLDLRHGAVPRAGVCLVVTQSDDAPDEGWNVLAPWLESAPALPDPGPQRPLVRRVAALTLGAAAAAAAARAARWATVREPRYAMRTGRSEVARTAPVPATAGGATPEQGMAFGLVVHRTLELLLRHPAVDLDGALSAALAVGGLAEGVEHRARAAVAGVVVSDLWSRALASDERYVEVPFTLPDPRAPVGAGAPTVPTVLTGAIDLVFAEADGWVIVDWKTDALSRTTEAEAMAHYGPQLAAYAQAWAAATRRPVKERGLYFTASQKWLTSCSSLHLEARDVSA